MRKKLKEVCDFYSGTGFPVKYQGEGAGELPFYKVGDIANNVTFGNVYLKFCNNYISNDVAKEIKGTIIPADVVVFAKIGEALKLNRRAITSCDCLIDNNAMGIGGKREYLNSMYFYFYMKNLKMETLAESTTVPSVRKTKLEEIEMEIPTLNEQGEIVDILAKLQKIISERQGQLEKLDELIKARFVEMFGDPEINEKQWPIHKLNELCNVGSSKRIYQNEQSSEGVPFWRISDLVNKMDTGMAESGLFIPVGRYDELKEQGLVPAEGDILVTSRGTLGRCYIISADDCFYFQDGMISWLSEYKYGITPLYLQYLFMTQGIKKQIDSMQAGSTVAYLSIAMLKKLDIMLPDDETQKQFGVFVAQVDKSKFGKAA